jgi:hypothetical protein
MIRARSTVLASSAKSEREGENRDREGDVGMSGTGSSKFLRMMEDETNGGKQRQN